MIGIGIDASSSKRLQLITEGDEHFRNSLLGCLDNSSPEALILSNYSIIEALFKALNCPTLFHPSEISISREESGHPTISLAGRMQERWRDCNFSVSVTHQEDLIIAVVVVYSNLDSKSLN